MSVVIQPIRIESKIRGLDDQHIPFVTTNRVAVVEEFIRRRMTPAIHPDGSATIVVLIRDENPIRSLDNTRRRRVAQDAWQRSRRTVPHTRHGLVEVRRPRAHSGIYRHLINGSRALLPHLPVMIDVPIPARKKLPNDLPVSGEVRRAAWLSDKHRRCENGHK